MVADSDPDASVVDLSDLEISTELDFGVPAGYRSKCGLGFCAPNQWVVSTEITPSKGASISFVDALVAFQYADWEFVLTIVKVLRFKESALPRIFLVGQSKLNPFPSSLFLIE